MGNLQDDLLNAVHHRGKSDVADAIGMPDDTDFDTLTKIIEGFRARHPGELEWHIGTIRQFFASGRYGSNLHFKGEAEVNKYSRMRHAVDLPMELGQAIEKVFPSMFRSKKHLRWFCKKFPGLTVSGKPL